MEPLAKHYDAKAAAAHWNAVWAEANYVAADKAARGPAFSMIMPPPNVTGSLHMGHALNNTLQDVLVRYRRMDGDSVCWIPGLDHASIAVHWLIEKQLRAEGKDRMALGRAAFMERAWAFKEEMQSRIVRQQKELALSCDWSRLTFTLDAGPSRAVTEAFVQLYQDGLIYRDERLVNWDPVSQTSVSDLEVVYEENVATELFSFAYPLVSGDGELVVATTRPETMLGDTAVAVHPDDPRFAHLIGQSVQHPFVARELPIVGDRELVDMAFGTGAVKITPAHDFSDFEVGRRHKLAVVNLLNKDGTLNENAGTFAGQTCQDARTAVIAALTEMGLARGSQPHRLNLGRSERSGAVIEPYLSKQWYVRTAPLRTPALSAVKQGRTKFIPAAWQNTYFSWLRDLRDWCISRQLWWGHQIPAWTCRACQALLVERVMPSHCTGCGAESASLERDPDVLDTWFSSALWPFSTQGWPKAHELERFYPTAALVTSFDIIFFWVARMMMLGQYFTGSVPFADVYIHALIRDAAGEKMSKTKGNVVDPLQMIERFGLDAFRFTLTAFAGQGRDVRWDEARAAGYQKFINKIWQATRFVAMQLEGEGAPDFTELAPPGLFDRWLERRRNACIAATRAALDSYKFNEAADAIYHFVWDELCDWSLELAKVSLRGPASTANAKARTLATLLDTFDVVARLLHPITPHLSEELYAALGRLDPRAARAAARAPHAMVAAYPKVDVLPARADDGDAASVLAVVRALRRVRTDFHVPVKERMQVLLRGTPAELAAVQAQLAVVAALTQADCLPLVGEPPPQSAYEWAGSIELFVPLAGLIDVAAEARKLASEADRATREAQKIGVMLDRPDFVARAPAEVVADKRTQLAELTLQAARLRQAHDRLTSAKSPL